MIPTQSVPLNIFTLCCARCRFWNQESDTDGLCELHLKHSKPKMTIDCGENTIRTEHDFGCVQFEAAAYSMGAAYVRANNDLIDNSGRLQFGRAHRNEDINDIAAEDPGYLNWMLDNVDDLSEDDREVIRVALQFAKRTRR